MPSHDVMPDMDLFQPLQIDDALALADRLGDPRALPALQAAERPLRPRRRLRGVVRPNGLVVAGGGLQHGRLGLGRVRAGGAGRRLRCRA